MYLQYIFLLVLTIVYVNDELEARVNNPYDVHVIYEVRPGVSVRSVNFSCVSGVLVISAYGSLLL